MVTDTIKDTVQQANPNPEPEPEPSPDPEPEPEPEASEVINSAKVNLTNVFPFCLPFDFIRLLGALSADAKTPCFEFPFVVPQLGIDMVIPIDLSFLDDVMEIVRIGETIGFAIMLMANTHKWIKW